MERRGCLSSVLNRFVCLSVYMPLSLSCVLCGSQQHDQGLTLLWWQLLAAVEKTDQFGFSLRRSPAMLPMTPQNIQLLGSTEGAGGHQKKRIVALQNEDSSPMNELIFCPLAPSHLHWHNAALCCMLQHKDIQLIRKNISNFSL